MLDLRAVHTYSGDTNYWPGLAAFLKLRLCGAEGPGRRFGVYCDFSKSLPAAITRGPLYKLEK
ncbi:hypothetical protein [Phyllobacterium zundukense]|uniref:Uncharacterized protein n=1 Tax=Phyllobacterium zundukense TaxID=1867719 RepID=A0A2N9VRQ7_9HYPH|nr:hypothetical protein [Phyllobacterium zundukense]ATU92599.1 hypothetical protein BLM14_13930 [Phyllobacterium zundukense]PIO42175.1 hypothetical protein B5P45_24390 [Phyllobacterium zundukense]